MKSVCRHSWFKSTRKGRLPNLSLGTLCSFYEHVLYNWCLHCPYNSLCEITQDKKNECGEEEKKRGEEKGDKEREIAHKIFMQTNDKVEMEQIITWTLLYNGLHLADDIG